MAKSQASTGSMDSTTEGVKVVMTNPTMLNPEEYVSGRLIGGEKTPLGHRTSLAVDREMGGRRITEAEATYVVKTKEYAEFLVDKNIARWPSEEGN